MTAFAESPIRRRADGSIDTDFYAHRAQNLRRETIRYEPARWAAWFRRWTRVATDRGSVFRKAVLTRAELRRP